MAGSTLSEMDAGTYVDRTGDIVLVFTDKDGKNKSLILQRDTEQGFGIFADMNDGYYEEDYSPYLPVRLFLPNIKRQDQITYDIEEIEQNEEYDGTWIGDQGTIIIHRGESFPYRMLHVMFSYDDTDELKFVLCNFSPIFSRFHTTEKFSPIVDDELLTAVPVTSKETDVSGHTRNALHDSPDAIQNQIDQLKEQVSKAINIAHTAEKTIDIIASSVSTLEEENKPHSDARDIPDSEGFWRDDDGDIWVRDIEGNTRLIVKGHKQGGVEIYNQSLNFSSDYNLHDCGPYVKIDNPFIQGEDHAK